MASKYKKIRLDVKVREYTLKEFNKTYLKAEKEEEKNAGVLGWQNRAFQRALEFYIQQHKMHSK
ncbi:MAG: hypothetical protein B655_1582 [Methanobacterium sp. Maddingley MBC34]|nr:MAG: hypothetical protein B655_1582 [Methanobacterium sp. Maddingley MBC34]